MRNRVRQRAFERLERLEGKSSRAVLRGREVSNDLLLPDQVMEKAGVFTDWRLIVHTDTEHVHAHVIAFREKTLVKAEFNAWRKEARSELEKLEQQRLQQEAEQEQARAQTLQAGAQEENSQLNLGWDIGL